MKTVLILVVFVAIAALAFAETESTSDETVIDESSSTETTSDDTASGSNGTVIIVSSDTEVAGNDTASDSSGTVTNVSSNVQATGNDTASESTEAGKDKLAPIEKIGSGLNEVKEGAEDLVEGAIGETLVVAGKAVEAAKKKGDNLLGDVGDFIVAVGADLTDCETDSNSTKASNQTNPVEKIKVGALLDLQNTVAADMDLKVLMMEDGTPKGKCYCSCNLNNRPVFLELDPSNLPAIYSVQ